MPYLFVFTRGENSVFLVAGKTLTVPFNGCKRSLQGVLCRFGFNVYSIEFHKFSAYVDFPLFDDVRWVKELN